MISGTEAMRSRVHCRREHQRRIAPNKNRIVRARKRHDLPRESRGVRLTYRQIEFHFEWVFPAGGRSLTLLLTVRRHYAYVAQMIIDREERQ